MSSKPSLIESINPTEEPSIDMKARLGEVDASMRQPAMLFLVSAVFWLLAGSAFAIMAAIKSTNPDFLGLSEWLTFGRVRTENLNAMIFGGGNNGIFAQDAKPQWYQGHNFWSDKIYRGFGVSEPMNEVLRYNRKMIFC